MPSTRSLQEVLIVAHFSAPQPLTVLDLTDWYGCIALNYPVFQQQPAWEPFIWQDIGTPSPNRPIVSQFMINQAFVPRVLGISEDQRWSVHCQGDRVALGWRRLEPTGDATPYPGFETVLNEAISMLSGFRDWWLNRFGVPVSFRLCELNYFNAFPFIIADRFLRLSEIFKIMPSQPGKTIANLNVSWIEPDEGPPQTRIQCLNAMGATLDCASVAIFNFLGSAKFEKGNSVDELRRIYETLHTAITTAYLNTIRVEIIGSLE